MTSAIDLTAYNKTKAPAQIVMSEASKNVTSDFQNQATPAYWERGRPRSQRQFVRTNQLPYSENGLLTIQH